ncbi:hypothetical protein BDV23DRAFT_171827 [Aspergillus alliaceus]|uniref:NAD(P)-binding domain-containing protein n=1 Tax=Petromyces alliaceus TaxID=209559 RepID=A0A5N7CCD2_PETAA|nr:hypothetical protein BDV23DRAFT_171827 [Aspergillus alliaceus]
MAVTVGIAGITSKFARLVLKKNLLEQPEVNIRGFCRNPKKLPEHIRSSTCVTIVAGDAGDSSALRHFAKRCDVVICCYLGETTLMTEGQKLLVEACDEENAPRYIDSDYCIDFTKLEYGQHPAKDPMKHVKAHLETKQNVRGVHGYFSVSDPKECKLSFYGTGIEVWESTTYATAAEYAIAADRTAVGMLHFLGDRKSIRQIANEFAEVYGRQPAAFQKVPSNIFAYLALFYQYYCINGQTYLKNDLDNARYPDVKPVTFEKFMQPHKLVELPDTYQNAGADA